LDATADYADKTDRRHRSKNGNQDQDSFGRTLLSPVDGLAAASLPEKAINQARRPIAPQAGCLCYDWSATVVIPPWENIVPEPVPLFVVLIKNEISDEGAKYEHTSKDIERN
jgi:hypothetical protein